MLGINQIDEILATTKYPIGHVDWVEESTGSSRRAIKTDLQINIDTPLRLELIIQTDIYSPLERGHLLLKSTNGPIERMHYAPDHRHINPSSTKINRFIRGKSFETEKHRYYPWSLNKPFGFPPPSGTIKVCEYIEEDLNGFMEGVNYFLERTNIELYVEPLEFQRRLAV